MLNIIYDKLKDSTGRTQQVTQQVKLLLEVLTSEMSIQELLAVLGLKDRMSMTNLYLRPALQSKFVEMTIPDKPNSKNQKYRITDKGKAILAIVTKGK